MSENAPPAKTETAGEADPLENEVTAPPEPEELLDALQGILEQIGIGEDDPRARVVISEVRTLVGYRGPIPPPQMLAEYERVHPGLAKRIVDAWDDQARHRKQLEAQMTGGAEARMNRSQVFALAVALAGLLVAGAVGIWGSWVAASVIAIVAVGGPSAATVIARYLPAPRD